MRERLKRSVLSFLWVICLLIAGCEREAPAPEYAPTFVDQPANRAATLVLGVHPLHNPQRLFQVYQPLVDHLNRTLPGARLRLEASRDYADFEKKLAGRHFHLALANPYQTIVSRQYGYHVFAKMGDDDNFRGILLVRKDGNIRELKDLKGKRISYPASTALAATVMPQWFLHQNGIDVHRDVTNLYVGSQESSIMNVYLGKTAAGATWPLPWKAFSREHPEVAGQLEVKWQTPPLVNNSLLARDDVPRETVFHIQRLLLNLPATDEGRAILAGVELTAFEAADDSAYHALQNFIERFEREVRPIKEIR